MNAAPPLVTLADIEAAATRISELVVRTPLLPLAGVAGPESGMLWCKPESLQPTGAFKLRGACNAIIQSLDQARRVGVVAQSSGNHGKAVAWLGQRLGIRVTIVMPKQAPEVKVAAVRAWGAEVELVEAERRDVRPLELAEEHGYVVVPPFDDLRVIAGQGTAGLELLADLPDLDTVLVPVSGGGLISGVATAVKSLRPRATVIGVEPFLAADAQHSLRADRRISWPATQTYQTIADGLRTTGLGVHPFEHVRRYVDDIVTVTDDEILDTIRHLAMNTRLVVEPAGAVAVAAWHHGRVPLTADTTTAAIVSGGSISPALLAHVLTTDGEPG